MKTLSLTKFIVFLFLFSLIHSCGTVDIEITVKIEKEKEEITCFPNGTVTSKKLYYKFEETLKFSNIEVSDAAAVVNIEQAGLLITNLPPGTKVSKPKIKVNGSDYTPKMREPAQVDPVLAAKIAAAINNSDAVNNVKAVDPVILPIDSTLIPVPSTGDTITIQFAYELEPLDSLAPVPIPRIINALHAFVYKKNGETNYRFGVFDAPTHTFKENYLDKARIIFCPNTENGNGDGQGGPVFSNLGKILMATILLIITSITLWIIKKK